MAQQRKPGATESGSSSYEESESDEEETPVATVVRQPEPRPQVIVVAQGEEEDEGDDEDTDSNSDGGGQYQTVRRDLGAAGAAIVAKPADNPAGKRVRDTNGGKGGPTEEPAMKKKKEGKDDKPRAQPVKGAPSTKAEKSSDQAVKAAKAVKGKPGSAPKAENGKPAAAARKRKASSPAGGTRGKGDADKSSPMKSTLPKASKKPIQWSPPQELALSNILLKDYKLNGIRIPNAKSDPFWEKLMKQLTLEGDLTEMQLSDKVRRMRQRHNILQGRLKEDGKHFKSSHEEKLFKIWDAIWRTPDEEESSADESAGTATTPGMVVKAPPVQSKGGDESSTEEEEDDQEVDDLIRKTAGLNEINAGDAGGKSAPLKAVSTPFVSKPKLEFTPMNKDDKRKPAKKGVDGISLDQPADEVLVSNDGRTVDFTSFSNEHMKCVRAEMASFLQEVRRNCFQLVEEIRGDRLGSMLGAGLGNTGFLDGLISSSGGEAAQELQKKWREHRVQELDLFSQRLQLLQEQCRLQQEELKLQNH